MHCFNIFKVSFGRSSPVLAILCSGADSNKKHSPAEVMLDGPLALWKLQICSTVVLRSCIHRPHSTVGTLWTLINVAEQIINYKTYDKLFLVEAPNTHTKNGCTAFEQITWRQQYLLAKASHTKLTLSPENSLSLLHSKHLCWCWYKENYKNIGESQILFS